MKVKVPCYSSNLGDAGRKDRSLSCQQDGLETRSRPGSSKTMKRRGVTFVL